MTHSTKHMVGAFAPPDLVDSQCTTISLEGAAIRVSGLLPVMLFHIFTFLVAAPAFLCPLPEVLCRRLLLDHCWDLLKGYQGKILKILFTTVLKKIFFYCSGFCHALTRISHGYTCIPHPDPPSHLPPHPIPLGLASAPALSTCLMHPTWAGDLFHPR